MMSTSTPKTHHFTPDHYWNTIGAHPPVLTIAPGDTVVTTTIDASGADANGVRVGRNPNPQTGPFFVEGAEPGDTLVVHIDRLTPNREHGYTGAVLAANVVDPEFARELPVLPKINWRVDAGTQTATPDPAVPGLEGFAIPLELMLGCFGVAAKGGQAISTMTSAEHGGNMDYRGFKPGTTVCLPVFEPGALFHLGDGHATQGDGEIAGTGIEISMDVQFTVELRKGWTINWPRGEHEDAIFTIGNARPLDQALQHATTEMMHWLQADYGLDVQAASTLLGQCVEYDVGNVYDPAYTMVCKVPKRVLALLGK
ncbi:MAG: acetamidase/formamidase family protein [Thermomicrobiales bacterium]